MREIKFRGKVTSDNHSYKKNQWVYGSYFKNKNKDSWILDNEENIFYMVDAKTVSEWTGLKDRYGNDIYEGDIVEESEYKKIGEIIWDKSSAMFVIKLKDFCITSSGINECKKIGNIWDDYFIIEKGENKNNKTNVAKNIYFEIDEIIRKIRFNEITKSKIKKELININNILRNTVFPSRKIYIVIDEGFIQGVYSRKEAAQKRVLEGFGGQVAEYWIDDSL